jgi:hypothetical protein
MTFGSVGRLFSDHPASVGETYLQHCRHALSFGWTMLRGAIACFLHAMFPWAHTRTGGNTVIRLYDRMVLTSSPASRQGIPTALCMSDLTNSRLGGFLFH